MAESINKWLFMGIATLVAMIDMGAVLSFGAYFIVIMDTFQTDRSTTATVQSLLIGFTFCFGIASGALISKLELPFVTLISSVLVTVGFCASFFATSVVFLYVSISIVAGIGISMAYISCVVVVSGIFKAKQKQMCIAVVSTSMSVGGLCYPYLIDLMNENYGIHGALLIQGGLNCNNFAFFVLCWVNRSKMRNYVKHNHIPNNRSYTETSYVLSDKHYTTVAKKKKSILEHLKILITFKFVCVMLGTGISTCAFDGFLSLVSDITVWKGFSYSQGLLSIVLFHSFSILGLLSPGLIKQTIEISSFVCPVVSVTLGCFAQIVIYVATGYVLYEVGIALGGMALGGIVSSSLVLVVELVHHKQVPVATGFMNTLKGVLTAGSGYGFGAFRDYSGSYNGVLVIIGIMLGIAAVLFSFGFIPNCRKLSPNELKEGRGKDPQGDGNEDRHNSVMLLSSV